MNVALESQQRTEVERFAMRTLRLLQEKPQAATQPEDVRATTTAHTALGLMSLIHGQFRAAALEFTKVSGQPYEAEVSDPWPSICPLPRCIIVGCSLLALTRHEL